LIHVRNGGGKIIEMIQEKIILGETKELKYKLSTETKTTKQS